MSLHEKENFLPEFLKLYNDVSDKPISIDEFNTMTLWKKSQIKTIGKKIQRSIHLLRTNPDYQRLYPQEAKSDPDRQNLTKVNPKIAKYIYDKMTKQQKRFIRPLVERPRRLNRA